MCRVEGMKLRSANAKLEETTGSLLQDAIEQASSTLVVHITYKEAYKEAFVNDVDKKDGGADCAAAKARLISSCKITGIDSSEQ
ncbi:hypothetical protein Zm00014a_003154 [Zea mays]|uniref:Uncharacterized protein n=1 Tax=Zea mays TaxID=4577 RepID=A0A3L6D5S5_MAIZE|nr:hypothetical protein Zm00014a_003154 [Zea mays]